jgi:hypothetical protein
MKEKYNTKESTSCIAMDLQWTERVVFVVFDIVVVVVVVVVVVAAALNMEVVRLYKCV